MLTHWRRWIERNSVRKPVDERNLLVRPFKCWSLAHRDQLGKLREFADQLSAADATLSVTQCLAPACPTSEVEASCLKMHCCMCDECICPLTEEIL